MLHIFNGLLGDRNKQDSAIVPQTPADENQDLTISDSSIELADSLSQKGKVQQAIALYREEIEKNPDAEEIKLKLVTLLQQQHNISESYKKLATALKKQGQTEQAAEYYRQAIVLKSLISDSSNKASQVSAITKVDISPNDDLSDSAFSFTPLIEQSSQPENSQKESLQIPTASDKSDSSLAAPEINLGENTEIAWETAQIYVEQALNAYDNCQWQETVNACQKILEIFPEMAEAYKILGNALQRSGETKKAMECYAQALKIEPDLAVVYTGIGKLYYEQQKWLQAKEYYQKATIINPRYPEAYHNLAGVWLHLGQPVKAEVCEQKATSLEAELLSDSSENVFSDSTQAAQAVGNYYQLAQNSEKNQKWQEAALYYRKALEIKNANFNYTVENGVNLNVSSILTNSDNSKNQTELQKAIQYYYSQAQLNPNSATIQFTLGNLYAKSQRWEEAIASYKRVIKIEPTYAQANINLAKALAKVDKQAEALDHLYCGYSIKPELATADDLFNLGNALIQNGDRRRAINCYSLAIDLKPNFVVGNHQLAQTLSEMNRRQEAIECYRQAIDDNPQDVDAYFHLGEQFVASKQWDDAVQAYRQLLELQPKYPQASYKLSRALSEKLRSELGDKH